MVENGQRFSQHMTGRAPRNELTLSHSESGQHQIGSRALKSWSDTSGQSRLDAIQCPVISLHLCACEPRWHQHTSRVNWRKACASGHTVLSLCQNDLRASFSVRSCHPGRPRPRVSDWTSRSIPWPTSGQLPAPLFLFLSSERLHPCIQLTNHKV
jgi:hypothetical protein